VRGQVPGANNGYLEIMIAKKKAYKHKEKTNGKTTKETKGQKG